MNSVLSNMSPPVPFFFYDRRPPTHLKQSGINVTVVSTDGEHHLATLIEPDYSLLA